jgi:hypothetical protein
MSVLRSINGKLERMVEGVFGRAFKASVQPVELAHKLAKEMGDHKVVSVASVYVPSEYEVYLSPADYKHLVSFEDALKAELGNYVAGFARREGWTMVGAPHIELFEDEELGVGEFGIATRMTGEAEVAPEGEVAPGRAPSPQPPPIAPPTMAQTVLYQPPAAPAAPAAPAREAPRLRAFLRGADGSFELVEAVTVVGRSRRCDIVLADPNVSRQHAEVRQENGQFVIVDLDSTNGLKVNRRTVKRAVLSDGDRLELGSSELRFERRS